MKKLSLLVYVLQGVAWLTFFPLTTVTAACVDTDVSVQVALRNRIQPTPQQGNTVDSYLGNDCLGNTATTTNTQFYLGNGDEVTQLRSRSIYMDTPYEPLVHPYTDTPNVVNHIGITMDLPLPLDLITP